MPRARERAAAPARSRLLVTRALITALRRRVAGSSDRHYPVPPVHAPSFRKCERVTIRGDSRRDDLHLLYVIIERTRSGVACARRDAALADTRSRVAVSAAGRIYTIRLSFGIFAVPFARSMNALGGVPSATITRTHRDRDSTFRDTGAVTA